VKLKYNDDKHAYWLDGVRCKGVTSIAKIPDDTYNLEQWRARSIVSGMARDPLLIERAQAHHDDRDILQDIASKAMDAARTHEASERGRNTHRIIERHITGADIIDTPHSRAVTKAWDKAMDAAGLTVVAVEQIVVHPAYNIAGRFDVLAKRLRGGKLAVVDTKTGASAVKYPHSASIQLGVYANAPFVAGKLDWRGETEEFEKMPDGIDKKYGYIVHMPTPEAVEVLRLDIGAGWDIFKTAILPVLEWRRKRDFLKSVGSIEVAELETPASPERVDWIKGRIALIGMVEDAKPLVARYWPNGLPTPNRIDETPWTEDDIDTLDLMLQRVELECSTPFAERDPAKREMRRA
jgi:hypothetical protein